MTQEQNTTPITNVASPTTTDATPTAQPTTPSVDARIAELERNPATEYDASLKAQLSDLHQERAFTTAVQNGIIELPSNFKTPGEFWKSHKELQKLATQKSQEAAELRRQIESQQNAPSANLDEIPQTTADVSTEVVPSGGVPIEVQGNSDLPTTAPVIKEPEAPQVDAKTNPAPSLISEKEYMEMAAEVARSGALSDEWMTKLTGRGLPKQAVSDFVTAQRVKSQQQWQQAINVVGSKDELFKVFEWAGKNLPKTSIEKINQNLADPDTSEMALRGLYAKYTATNRPTEQPKAPAVQPTAQPTDSQKQKIPAVAPQSRPQDLNPPYNSIFEFYKDRDDPRYTSDPRFRNAVAARLAKSPFVG